MDWQLSKRRRVYSLEPNEKVSALFARKYVNHLVPALKKINQLEKISSAENGVYELEKIVRHEVDMAMVLSAEEFAWSRALKQKLQRNTVNAGGFQNHSFHHLTSLNCNFTCGQKSNCIIDEKGCESSSLPPVSNALIPMKFSQNPNSKLEIKKSIRAKRLLLPLKEENLEENEEEKISCQLKKMRNILPGGNEMDVDVLLTELGSYITCLELQVNVLQCLAKTH
ncbi:transcription factor bHLH146 [Quercus suber]|uniref:Transcription factor bhlh146 n=1 Tax=Quercus suber TaxID=58331 RepID=A0AAW0LFJ8_QUESU|nr:transcription factor bHLH146-like [Quercus suber]POF06466.1 uncharacterized protein CFP56_57438 [Quercus suber]